MKDPVNRPRGMTRNLSVKVPPEFAAQLRDMAARRGVDLSMLLRERLGICQAPLTLQVPQNSLATAAASVPPPVRRRRPKCLAPQSGSDPVLVQLLASVANGLVQLAASIRTTQGQLADARVLEILGAMAAMNARLDVLINQEERKGAH